MWGIAADLAAVLARFPGQSAKRCRARIAGDCTDKKLRGKWKERKAFIAIASGISGTANQKKKKNYISPASFQVWRSFI